MKRLLTILFVLGMLFQACKEKRIINEVSQKQPDIFPDYVGVTIPSMIAPLNFKGKGKYEAIAAEFKDGKDEILTVEGDESIIIPKEKWKRLLEQSGGDSLKVTVLIKNEKGWTQYAPFYIHVSAYPIDYGLVYRRIAPGYQVYSHMGIYQRNLSSFDESPIVENTLVTGSCVNCHSFSQNDASTMMFHMRGAKGGTILRTKEGLMKLNTKTEQTIGKFQYPYWHPSKNYIAYTVNKTAQTFHSYDANRVEVFDSESDVIVYDLRKNTILVTDKLSSKDWYETWPTFSPKGDYLYYVTAHALPMPENYNKLKYSLCRIGFDAKTGEFGNEVDTLISSTATDKSVAFPRISPDGRFLMMTQFDYGNFPIWHKEADLIILDLESGEFRKIDEVNSNDVESYHSWSSNGRWFVFSSRRVNGLYTMPFIAFFDENGKAGKPFLLPQEDPDYYDQLLYSFNIPELVNGRVDLDISTLEREVTGKGRDVTYMQID